MISITNKLNIKYRPWKIYATRDDAKNVWAETTQAAADQRQQTLESEGWQNITTIAGRSLETDAA